MANISVRSKKFSGAVLCGNWLLLCTPEKKLSGEGSLMMMAVSTLAGLRAQYPQLRGVGIIGPDKEKTPTGKESYTATGLRFNDKAEIEAADKILSELAKIAVAKDYALGGKVFDKIAWGPFSKKKSVDLKEDILTGHSSRGGWGKGDLDNPYVALVAPEMFDLKRCSQVFLDRLLELKVEKLDAPELKKTLQA